MDNYIVRIYRRDRRHPERVVGMVVNVKKDSQQPFHTARELLAILLAPRPGKRRARTEPRKAKTG